MRLKALERKHIRSKTVPELTSGEEERFKILVDSPPVFFFLRVLSVGKREHISISVPEFARGRYEKM